MNQTQMVIVVDKYMEWKVGYWFSVIPSRGKLGQRCCKEHCWLVEVGCYLSNFSGTDILKFFLPEVLWNLPLVSISALFRIIETVRIYWLGKSLFPSRLFFGRRYLYNLLMHIFHFSFEWTKLQKNHTLVVVLF